MSDPPMTAEAPPSRMPGGGVSRRPMHFIILADCSGGMKGEKIQALNFAIADMMPQLAAWERDQEQARVLVRAVAFATEPRWHIPDPVPVSKIRWKPLQPVPKGLTNMGPAFAMVAEALAPGRLERRALRPALLLITDGMSTDPPGALEAGLSALMSQPAGRAALRLSLAIGRDAQSDALEDFIGDPSVPVLVADNTEDIADRLVAASLALSKMSEVGADRSALARTLLGPAGVRRAIFEQDTII
ncbi:MAG: VWA domain-containing protein [Actinobacteria bacterium]|nr:VWA domain-containing protein [Actinomycetota bacterium]